MLLGSTSCKRKSRFGASFKRVSKVSRESLHPPYSHLSHFAANSKSSLPSFYAVQTTPGPLRRPPNVYDSTVFASTTPSPIPFPTCAHPSFAVAHPAIPTLKMIANVLSPTTCESIIRSANTLGWEADQAAGGSAVDKTSVLAHNVVWLADEEFVGELFERIKPFVQEHVGGGKVRGINRRMRVYRYGPKQVYRVGFPILQSLKLYAEPNRAAPH